MRIAKALLAGFFAFLIVGCATKPIQEVHQEPIVTSNGRHITMAKMHMAILRAGQSQNWHMKTVRSGLIFAWYQKGKYNATVEIPYNPHNYSIVYRNSTNFGYKEGKINKHYNLWVDGLDKAIRCELTLM